MREVSEYSGLEGRRAAYRGVECSRNAWERVVFLTLVFVFIFVLMLVRVGVGVINRYVILTAGDGAGSGIRNGIGDGAPVVLILSVILILFVFILFVFTVILFIVVFFVFFVFVFVVLFIVLGGCSLGYGEEPVACPVACFDADGDGVFRAGGAARFG
ncbi:MAG TPA: hypothetical protein VEX87_16920 [Skermanella sp.]|nr:hypothetical protein [Skermanella sp.]